MKVSIIRVATVYHNVHWPYSHGGRMSYCCVPGCKSHKNGGNLTHFDNFRTSWLIWNWKADRKLRFWRDIRTYFRLKQHLITCWLTLSFSHLLVNLLLDRIKRKLIWKHRCTSWTHLYQQMGFKICCFTLKYPSRCSQSRIFSVADANSESASLTAASV